MALLGGAVLAMACSAAPTEGETQGEASSDLILYNPPPFAGCKGLRPLSTHSFQGYPINSCPVYPPSSNTNCLAGSVIGYSARFQPTTITVGTPWSCPPVRLSSGALWQGELVAGTYHPWEIVPRSDEFNCMYLFDDLQGQTPIDASPFCSTNAGEIGYVFGPPAVRMSGADGGSNHPGCDVCSTY
jgi:hypothetical protein